MSLFGYTVLAIDDTLVVEELRPGESHWSVDAIWDYGRTGTDEPAPELHRALELELDSRRREKPNTTVNFAHPDLLDAHCYVGNLAENAPVVRNDGSLDERTRQWIVDVVRSWEASGFSQRNLLNRGSAEWHPH